MVRKAERVLGCHQKKKKQQTAEKAQLKTLTGAANSGYGVFPSLNSKKYIFLATNVSDYGERITD